MPLVLKVISINNQTPQNSMKYEFCDDGGTIGRKPSNSWVLPDEQRHLSGMHASIEFTDGSYYLVDTSTNGVFINGNEKPLGKGNKQLLEDGFQLLMGTFNIEVLIENEAKSTKSLPDDILTESNTPDDLFSDLIDDSKEEVEENFFEPVNTSTDNPPIKIGSDDPFFEFDEFIENSDSREQQRKSIVESNASEMDSFFSPAKIIKPSQEDFIKKEESQKNNTKESNDIFLEPDNNQGGIPDDWNLESSPKDSFDELLTGFENSTENKPKIQNTSVDEPKEIPKNAFNSTQHGKLDTDSTNTAFLKGLGLDDDNFENGLTEQQLFLAGKLFRCAIQGTVDVLLSRAEIKNEMRMDMTTIQPIQNNPIKFALNIDETIKKLLDQNNGSYMDPEQAMNEVYDDITSHQLAVIAGIQASLSHVLRRFEPKNLITRFEKDNPISASIPVHRKAKLWEVFEDLYEAIEMEAEDDFNRLFGQEFAKAYDQQVESLKKKRTK